jgi:hypothetical protein
VRIQGKISADVDQVRTKRNKSHDGKTTTVDIDVSVKRDDAATKFGEDFEALAFATMRTRMVGEGDDAEERITFLQDDIKPGSVIVLERHQIKIDGDLVEVQPQLLGVTTVDGEARVIVHLRIPVDSDRASQMGISDKVNKTIPVEFEPKQSELPLRKKRGALKAVDSEEAESH